MNIRLTNFEWSDASDILEWHKEKDIYNTTLMIPYPYSMDHAYEWINYARLLNQKNGNLVMFAIRDGVKCIGSIGFDHIEIGKDHKAELGYWLAKPYWGKGIMTNQVSNVCKIAFDKFSLKRIEANVFASNIGSACVLEKVGFQFEGISRNYYSKDGKIFDRKKYSLLDTDPIIYA